MLLVLVGGVVSAQADVIWDLRGTFNNWTGNTNVFTNGSVTLDLEANQSYKFKVVKNNDTWYGAEGGFNFDWTVSETNNISSSNEARDFILFTPLAGTYTFNLTISDENPTELSITFPSGTWDKTTIYFCNTLNWETPYFYIRTNAYYDGTNGSGSNQCPNGMLMTQIGGTNIWKAEFPTAFLDNDIAFLDQKQDSYDNFYNAKASVRGDFSTNMPLFVPNTTSNDIKNGTTYYSNGMWQVYPTYTRSVNPGYFGTICLPFAASVDGATVFEITGKVMEGNTLKGINLSSVDNLVAGKAYIFKATETTLTATLSGNYTDAITGDAMIGNISSDKYYVPVNMYVVGSDNKIHRVAGANKVWIGRYKGYIDLDNIVTVSAPGLNFIDFDDDATGIEGLEVENIQDVIYDMQGRQVKDVKKGLYIINGKKVLVK